MLRRLFLIAATAALIPTLAAAEELDEVIVTATRLPSGIDLVTGARVIDEGELSARQSAFAADVLATVPGVGVARNGAFGGIGAIRIRGATPDKTLVLVDGVPVGDPADPNGTFDPAALQLSDVARIEVLSGPQGSLWGSEAIGGVVSFVTRELSGWRVETEGGSYATARGFAGVGHAEDAWAASATVAGFRTDGVSKAASGAESDGFETFTANLGGRVKVGAAALDGRLRHTEADAEIDGFAPPAFVLGDTPDRNTTRAWSGYGRVTADAFGLTHKVSLSAYDLRRRNVSAFPSAFDAERQVLRWTAETDRLVLGVERMASGADLDGRDSLDLSTASAFAVGRAEAGPLTLTASVRHDAPDAFDARTTGRLSAAWRLGGGFVATASAGTGFKVPTISQALCDFCFPAGPALDLKPEAAEGYDLRLGWRSDDGRLSAAVTGYRLSVKDQIAYTGRYVNLARTRSTGLEAEADLQLTDQLRLRLAYARTDAVDASSGASLIRVPDHMGAASLMWDGDRLSGALTVRAESSQADTDVDGFSRVVRDGFAVADLAVAWALNDRISLTARIENLTDQDYAETFGYGEPGRAVFVGVRLRN